MRAERQGARVVLEGMVEGQGVDGTAREKSLTRFAAETALSWFEGGGLFKQ